MTVSKDVHHHSDPADPPKPVATPATETEAAVHLVRLCLDLQLDAMLLALGAAAAQPEDETTPPWRRWVTEDLHLARGLAADVITAGATLPPMLGSDLDHAVSAAAVDNLVARYESMEVLLVDVARAGGSSGHAAQALARCQERLRELRATRLDATPARGIDLTYFEPRHRALPGEWLG